MKILEARKNCVGMRFMKGLDYIGNNCITVGAVWATNTSDAVIYVRDDDGYAAILDYSGRVVWLEPGMWRLQAILETGPHFGCAVEPNAPGVIPVEERL